MFSYLFIKGLAKLLCPVCFNYQIFRQKTPLLWKHRRGETDKYQKEEEFIRDGKQKTCDQGIKIIGNRFCCSKAVLFYFIKAHKRKAQNIFSSLLFS